MKMLICGEIAVSVRRRGARAWDGRPVAAELAHLIDDDADHVALRTLQRAERAAEVEENVVLLALHADTQQETAARVQIKPELVRQEVAKVSRIQPQIGASAEIVLADKLAVPHRGSEPHLLLDGNVEQLVPSRVRCLVDGARLGYLGATLVAEGDEGVDARIGGGRLDGHEVLTQHDPDGEDVAVVERLVGHVGRRVLDDVCLFVGVDLRVQLVEQQARGLDVVELHAGLQRRGVRW